MATIGRKNVHGKGGVRFKSGFTPSKKKAMLRNLVTDLIVHEHVTVTKTVARDLIKVADRMVTYAKRGDLSSRREAARFVRENVMADAKNNVNALQKLFNEIGPRYKDRQGGYTKALNMGFRRGDNAPMALVTFVK